MTDDAKEDALTPKKAADDAILIYDAVLPKMLVQPWLPFPNRIPRREDGPR